MCVCSDLCYLYGKWDGCKYQLDIDLLFECADGRLKMHTARRVRRTPTPKQMLLNYIFIYSDGTVHTVLIHTPRRSYVTLTSASTKKHVY